MTDLMPIVPNCLAIIRSGIDAGLPVTVLCKEQPPFLTQDIDCWRIDTPVSWRDNFGYTFKDPYCPENMLLRIDGLKEPTTQEEEVEV